MSRELAYDWKRFRGDLDRVCAERGVSIDAMCLATGVHHASVSRMKAGGGLHAPAAIKLCEWAGLDPMRYLHASSV